MYVYTNVDSLRDYTYLQFKYSSIICYNIPKCLIIIFTQFKTVDFEECGGCKPNSIKVCLYNIRK